MNLQIKTDKTDEDNVCDINLKLIYYVEKSQKDDENEERV